MKNIDLSIIIPVYNVQNYLQKCINSIINQKTTYKYEIILIDDGSEDESGTICDEFSQKYCFVKTIHKTNGGVSSARNLGLKNSHGKYIMFIDSDDALIGNVIDNMLSILEKNNTQLLQFNYNEIIEKTGAITQRGNCDEKLINIIGEERILKEFFKKNITISLWNKIFSREIIKDISFNENIHHYEDKLFIFLAILNCKKYTQVNILGYNYLKREKSASYDLFKYSYLEILDVDKIIVKEIEEKFKNIVLYAKANELEGNLELVKMMIKSRAFKQYTIEYKEILKKIKKYNFKIIFYLRIKKKIEYIFIKYFLKIYEYLMMRK